MKSQIRLIVSLRMRTARASSPAPIIPPSPGMIATMSVATATMIACGRYFASVYVVTSAGEPTTPRTTTSLASMIVITRFHRRNHQLRPTK